MPAKRSIQERRLIIDRIISEAKDNYALGKLEKRIQKVDLLIIDEMGYVSFDRFQSELLFKVIADEVSAEALSLLPIWRFRNGQIFSKTPPWWQLW